MKKLWYVFIIALAATESACGVHSSYTRTTAHPGEIVWAYDDGLTATRDGVVVAKSTGWSGLADAVGCVEPARVRAEEAQFNGSVGPALGWTGAVGMVASPVVGIGSGIAIGSLSVFGESTAVAVGMLSGIAIGVATFTAAWGMSVSGAALQAMALPGALDAVNIYNDVYETTAACRR
jgi:hypothetical protein